MTKQERIDLCLKKISEVKNAIKNNSYNGTCIVSVSGGETSMDMAIWLKENTPELKKVYIFDNTSRETEETLLFIDRCDKEYSLGVIWLEAVITIKKKINGIVYTFDPIVWNRIKRKYWKKFHNEYYSDPTVRFREIPGTITKDSGITHKVVDFESARRDGRIFVQQIAKEGIPNTANAACTSRLKVRTTKHYVRSVLKLKHDDCCVAVGIRSDEIDRMKLDSEIAIPFYPYISLRPHTKPMINRKWALRNFRLGIKSWMGNCKDCFKKTLRSLITIFKYYPDWFHFQKWMQIQYGYYVPDSRIEKAKEKGEEIKYPIRFHRKSMSVEDIESMLTDDFVDSNDTSDVYDEDLDLANGCSDSCEAF